MSITQTYFLAHTARGKLSKEASRADHDLRLLVGHANLLDSLMLELADAEQEQERWFNNTVSGAAKEEQSSEPKHIQWADTVIEEPEEDWEASDASASDSDSEYDEDEDIAMVASPQSIRRSPSRAAKITTREISDDEEDEEDEDFEEDDEEDYSDLALTRTSSRHPPELTSDSEEDSDEESMPPSPPQPTLQFSEKQRAAIATTSFYDDKSETTLSEQEQTEFFEEGYYLPQRAQSAMITAY